MRIARLILIAAVGLLAAAAPALAQCAMCKTAIAGAEDAREVARIFNAAVLVLFIPTLVIFGALIGLVFRRRHSRGGEWQGEGEDPR